MGERSPGVAADRRRTGGGRRVKDVAVASMINGVAMAGLDGRLTYVNSSFLKMWGYDSEAEVLDRSFAEFWQSEEEAAFVVSALHERGSWAGELPAKRKDGAAIHVQLSASMITNDEGRPVHMVGSFIDITQRREARASLIVKYKCPERGREKLEISPCTHRSARLWSDSSKSFRYWVTWATLQAVGWRRGIWVMGIVYLSLRWERFVISKSGDWVNW